ncbi:DUF3024 domain-containing protein [Pedobacter sp. NJ-S-72]
MTETQLKNFIESLKTENQELRLMLDFGYTWDGQSATLYEIRPQWNNPTKILHLEFAKLRFIKTTKIWRLYWKRGSGKWEAYGPHPKNSNLQELLIAIKKDSHCFFSGN